MKTLAIIIGTTAPVSAIAAATPNVNDSGFFSWVFLGLCTLLILSQAMPAVLLMFGIAKEMTGIIKDEMKGH